MAEHVELPARDVATASADPFDAGPFAWTHDPLPLSPDWHCQPWRRALSTVLISWAPLVVLSAVEGLALGRTTHEPMLRDLAAYGRYVVAAPVFACAGCVILPRLALVVRGFIDAELIAVVDRPRYDHLVASTRRLLVSRWTHIGVVLVAYTLTGALGPRLYPGELSTWVRPIAADGTASLSLAGWWRLLISQPLFLALQAVWVWRLLVWIRFLFSVARMKLRLVAAHPDSLGGLRFALAPIRSFAILAFGVGSFAAGSVADSVLIDGQPFASFRYVIAAQTIGVVAFLAGPALLLMTPLIQLQEWGTRHYGRLASDMGHEFERRWLRERRRAHEEALGAPDFSAAADLYGVVANVRAINPFVLEWRQVIVLAVATLLPYVPLVFAMLPVDAIVEMALKAIA